MSKPHTYTAQYLGKWHAGFNIGNQSFVLQAHEGTEEEAKWYAEMMDKAFAKLRVVKDAELIQQLVDALNRLVYYELCNEEGLSSGAPTAKDWKKAFDKAQQQIDAAADAGFKPSGE